jgi:hypothetical protein
MVLSLPTKHIDGTVPFLKTRLGRSIPSHVASQPNTTSEGEGYYFFVVDRFSKMVHFIPFHKSDDVFILLTYFFKKSFTCMVCLLLMFQIGDAKFLSHFWHTL